MIYLSDHNLRMQYFQALMIMGNAHLMDRNTKLAELQVLAKEGESKLDEQVSHTLSLENKCLDNYCRK